MWCLKIRTESANANRNLATVSNVGISPGALHDGAEVHACRALAGAGHVHMQLGATPLHRGFSGVCCREIAIITPPGCMAYLDHGSRHLCLCMRTRRAELLPGLLLGGLELHLRHADQGALLCKVNVPRLGAAGSAAGRAAGRADVSIIHCLGASCRAASKAIQPSGEPGGQRFQAVGHAARNVLRIGTLALTYRGTPRGRRCCGCGCPRWYGCPRREASPGRSRARHLHQHTRVSW